MFLSVNNYVSLCYYIGGNDLEKYVSANKIGVRMIMFDLLVSKQL
jgi:hypothetical protein